MIQQDSVRRRALNFLMTKSTVMVFCVLCVVLVILHPEFLSPKNLTNVARQITMNAIIAAGMTLILLTGEIDLSVGSVVALTGILVGLALQAGVPVPLAVAIGLLTGLVVGCFNGLAITRFKIPFFITTLATMIIIRGVAYLVTGGMPVAGFPRSAIKQVASGRFGVTTDAEPRTHAVARARDAQPRWAARSVGERLVPVRALRTAIGDHPQHLVAALAGLERPDAVESLSAELLPLADACRYLEREAEDVLAPRRLGRTGRPLWLAGVRAEVRREPFGVVLVVGPSNYPLLLPGVQAVQGLVAGNAVLWKPGRGGGPAARAVASALACGGLPALPPGALLPQDHSRG